nr:ATPase, T2SS/T4P/T4SS family [Actinopolymorpha pittospori]
MSDLPTDPADPTNLPIFGGRPDRVPPAAPRAAASVRARPAIRPHPHQRAAAVPVDAPTDLPESARPRPANPASITCPTAAHHRRRHRLAPGGAASVPGLRPADSCPGRGAGHGPRDREGAGPGDHPGAAADHGADRLHDGESAWTLEEQDTLAEAVFNALFGLGRLQPLVDDDSVENIIITGADNVWLEKIDGTLVKAAPVADSDQELSFVASRSEVNARSFSSATPRLHMRLDGGSRLAAAAWVTAHPSVVIRRHRLRRVTLDDLVERDMLTHTQATFLRAAIKARKSVVVAGGQGAGKTTVVRALCAVVDPWEAIGTFETEFELHLHELKDIHPIVHAWEARPGSGGIGPDGKQAGEFTLDEALYDSFRFNLSRQIVGEVRGREVWAMIKAMESGAGSISTTHAASGEAAIRKLVTCAMEAGPHVTKELATSKLAETIDIIVQVHLETVPLDGGDKWRRSRWVSEIIHVAPGEAVKGYATTHVFRPNPAGGPAIPGTMPDELRSLERYGFDLSAYLAEDGREEDTL